MEAIPTESDAVLGDLNGRGTGCVGVMSARDKISLHRGALLALQEHADGRYPGMRVALASSANTPFAERVGRKALAMLEVLPGLTVWDLLMRDWGGVDVNQIGRQPPLSPNKAETHFPRLRERRASALTRCSSSTTATGPTTAPWWRTSARRRVGSASSRSARPAVSVWTSGAQASRHGVSRDARRRRALGIRAPLSSRANHNKCLTGGADPSR